MVWSGKTQNSGCDRQNGPDGWLTSGINPSSARKTTKGPTKARRERDRMGESVGCLREVPPPRHGVAHRPECNASNSLPRLGRVCDTSRRAQGANGHGTRGGKSLLLFFPMPSSLRFVRPPRLVWL